MVLEGRCGGMIIRSQDKKSIINFNEIDTIKCKVIKEVGVFKPFHETEIRYFRDTEDCGLLGSYSTEGKAIKVLDMIQKAYNSIETMKIDKGAWRDNHYFEMPQDSEI